MHRMANTACTVAWYQAIDAKIAAGCIQTKDFRDELEAIEEVRERFDNAVGFAEKRVKEKEKQEKAERMKDQTPRKK